MSEIRAILRLLAAHPGSPAVLATLVSVEGSSYRKPGARLLWLPEGVRAGSISGGCLEEDLLERARRVLETGRAETALYDTTAENDLVWGTGTGCDGRAKVLLERLPAGRPRWCRVLQANHEARRDTALAVVHGAATGLAPGTRLAADLPAGTEGALVFHDTVPAPLPLVIVGAGDDAQPLVRLAAELGWHVTVVDSRPAYATPERFPGAAAVVAAPPASAVESAPIGSRASVVVMTHRYRDDAVLLRSLLPKPLAYLGLLGPRHRTQRLLAEIEAGGLTVTDDMRARLHAPVGLDLGGTTPETVALSILAEIQARLAGRQPVFLRDRPGPIHA